MQIYYHNLFQITLQLIQTVQLVTFVWYLAPQISLKLTVILSRVDWKYVLTMPGALSVMIDFLTILMLKLPADILEISFLKVSLIFLLNHRLKCGSIGYYIE